MERPHLKQKKFPQLVQVILLQPSDFSTAILQLGHCFASLLIYSMFRTSLINSFSFLKASSPISLPFCRPCNLSTTTEGQETETHLRNKIAISKKEHRNNRKRQKTLSVKKSQRYTLTQAKVHQSQDVYSDQLIPILHLFYLRSTNSKRKESSYKSIVKRLYRISNMKTQT